MAKTEPVSDNATAGECEVVGEGEEHEFLLAPDDSLALGKARLYFTGMKGGSAKLALSAPPEVKILRGELSGREPRKARMISLARRIRNKEGADDGVEGPRIRMKRKRRRSIV